MPDKKVATDDAVQEPASLADQIMDEDLQELEGEKEDQPAEENLEEGEQSADESDAPEDDKKDGEDGSPSESEDESESEEDEGSEESESEEEEESKEEEPGEKSYKLGNREFNSVEDVIGEAERIIGQNANLAGQYKQKEAELAELKTKLDEALEANKEWEEYAQDPDNKTSPNLNMDKLAEKVTSQVVKSLEEKEAEKAQAEARKEFVVKVKAEADEIAKLPNFYKIKDDFNKIVEEERQDPMTGKPFNSPKRLYSYLCKELGLEDMIKSGDKKPATKEIKKPSSVMRKAAVRPTGSKGASGGKEVANDDFHEALSETLPALT